MAISLFISYFFSVVRTFSNAITLCQSPCLANKWHFGLFPSTAVSMLKVDVFCKTEKIAGYEKGKKYATWIFYWVTTPQRGAKLVKIKSQSIVSDSDTYFYKRLEYPSLKHITVAFGTFTILLPSDFIWTSWCIRSQNSARPNWMWTKGQTNNQLKHNISS